MAKCILIVDDSEVIRTATRHFLEDETDFTVCGEAIDGLDAIGKVRHLSPDLIVLDLAMPRMNGLQAARRRRAMSVQRPSFCSRCTPTRSGRKRRWLRVSAR